jgi:uncharacterized protein
VTEPVTATELIFHSKRQQHQAFRFSIMRRSGAFWNTISAFSTQFKGGITMLEQAETIASILNEIVRIDGVTAAIIIGRDGFVIEAEGDLSSIDVESLGSSLAGSIAGIEKMSSEMKITDFRNMFLEYEKALIVGIPIEDAVLAIIADDASSIGMIRLRLQSPIPKLKAFF